MCKKKKKEEKKPMANLLAYVFFFHNASFVCENTPEKEKAWNCMKGGGLKITTV